MSGGRMLPVARVEFGVGWATTIPSFRRAGFQIDDSGMSSFAGVRGWSAVGEFFDIEYFDCLRLFGASLPNSKALAVKRIRRFVAKADALKAA